MSPSLSERLNRSNRLPCVFSVALDRRLAVCELACRGRGDGEVLCISPLARAGCGALYGYLRRQAAFVLKLRPGKPGPLPKAIAIKIQCGGLTALCKTLTPGASAPNVHRLLLQAQMLSGGMDRLPATQIVREIVRCRC